MSTQTVFIRFEGVEEWENQRSNVDQILERATETSDYPETKSLPPIIFGPKLTQNAIDDLNSLEGVVVNLADDS